MADARPLQTSLEVERMTPYLWFLFVLLSTAPLFDGFDAGMLSFAAPESRRTLEIARSGATSTRSFESASGRRSCFSCSRTASGDAR